MIKSEEETWGERYRKGGGENESGESQGGGKRWVMFVCECVCVGEEGGKAKGWDRGSRAFKILDVS